MTPQMTLIPQGRITQPFSMYCECEVVYDGRACSTLERGNYLILCKPDLCIAIHGSNFIKPLNYQNPKSSIYILNAGQEFDDIWTNLFDKKPKLIVKAVNKKESLTIAVYTRINYNSFENWTNAKIKLIKSERDLVNQILSNLSTYFPSINMASVDTEIPTPYGNIDILIIDQNNIYHIVEVKRKIMSVAGCGQLARYGVHYKSIGIQAIEYLAAPLISKNALIYADRNNQQWIQATFDETTS